MEFNSEAREILQQAGTMPDDALDIAETALALAALHAPAQNLQRARDHLQVLVHEISRVPEIVAIEDKIRALRSILVARHNYNGDDDHYDDLDNANLLKVIERRRGLPVALGVIYLHVARKMNWQMNGLNFPGHFLVRLDHGSQRAILDPFYACKLRQPEELRDLVKASEGPDAELLPAYYLPVTARDVVLRLQNNIKVRMLQHERIDEALTVLQGMLLMAPARIDLWREVGLLQARNGNLRASISALETVLNLAADQPVFTQTQELIQQLRRQLH